MLAKLSRCVRCGSNEIDERTVEELVREGPYVAAMRLFANVCSSCGERFFEQTDAQAIEDVRRRLERGELEGL